VEPTEVAVINRHRFLFLVHETPMFAIEVMRAMAARIHELNSVQ
jgi:CRP-like cAMP-binding protein